MTIADKSDNSTKRNASNDIDENREIQKIPKQDQPKKTKFF